MKREQSDHGDFEWQPALFALAIFLVGIVVLSGCTTAPQAPQTVKVAVPIKCKAVVPSRPAMPTRSVQVEPVGTFLDRFVAAATAEIELRQGYENRLVTELQSCL